MKQLFLIFSASVISAGMACAQACEANFNHQADTTGLGISFKDSSTGTPVSWAWDFGDGYFSSKKNPQHVYGSPGVYPVCLIISTGSCQDTLCKTIRAGCDKLKADFGFRSVLTTVSFSDSSSDATAWSWDFGDGKTSVSRNPVHTYAGSGTYTVCLIASKASCKDTLCRNISIRDCRSDFYFDPDTAGNGVHFSDVSQGNLLSRMWYFGDGDKASVKDPFHVYDTPGTYTVCLVTQTATCKDSVCKMVRVGTPACKADFTVKDSLLKLSFFDASQGDTVAKWEWDFGDGTGSNARNPVHAYGLPGNYTVCLTTYTGTSCTDKVCKGITAGTCLSDFTLSPDSAGNGISFQSLAKGNISSRNWDFGDGTSSTQANPRHVYVKPGTYQVCLEVKSNNCSDKTCKMIRVPGCTADFSYSEDSLQYIRFTAAAKGKITKYEWNFGDGSTSPLSSPGHKYGKPGIYTVCLKVWNDTLCSAEVCKKVTVRSCRPGFAFVSDTSGYVVSFSDLSQGPVTGWQWDFNDGFSSAQQHPVHTYQQKGVYKVCLTVEGDSLCSGTVCKNVPVKVSCEALYTFKATTGLSIAFRDSSQAFPSSWTWTFGDGDSAFVQHPVHTFKAAGNYAVCLTMKSDLLGCSDSYCKIVEVKKAIEPPDPCDTDFSYAITGAKVNFLSKGTSPLAQWDFGDSTTANGPVAEHTYAKPGTYNVCLTVVSLSPPCYKSGCKKILITATGKEEHAPEFPVVSVYPNPFAQHTKIECRIDHDDAVDLGIYDVLGNRVATLLSGTNLKGQYQLRWDAGKLSPGTYFLKLTGSEPPVTHRIVLFR